MHVFRGVSGGGVTVFVDHFLINTIQNSYSVLAKIYSIELQHRLCAYVCHFKYEKIIGGTGVNDNVFRYNSSY